MRAMTLQEVAEWVDGALIQGTPSTQVSRITTDSRDVKPTDLFVALRGERFDAHQFLDQVSEAGASAIFVSDLPASTERFSGGIIRVKDTLHGLQRLAYRYRRSLSDLFVVGITGSNGKTSTKDFLAAVLSEAGPVNATKGNLNNHIGLPMTILSTELQDRHGVWEMGMNHRGEIGVLTDIAVPDAAVITMIGTAHIEYMGSREAIAEEKATLAEAIPTGGFCAMPASDDFYDFVKERACCDMVPVGIEQGMVRAERLTVSEDGRSHFHLASDATAPVSVDLPVRGEHMVMNALLAAAVGLRRGIPADRIAAALSTAQLNKGRLKEKQIGGITFLDDSYNANPDSMLAALRILQSAKVTGRRVAVFGHMGELGEHEKSEHLLLGQRAAAHGVEILVTVGERAARIGEGASDITLNENFPDHNAAADFLRDRLKPGDFVLVKGSRSTEMERVIAAFESKF